MITMLTCMVVLLLAGQGCRKDPDLATPGAVLCTDLWEWHAMGSDTLDFGESSTSYAFVLQGLPGYLGDCSFGLGFMEQDMNPGPGTSYAQEVYLNALSIDSIAFIRRALPNSWCQMTWNPRDTLYPSMVGRNSIALYSNYPSSCPDPNAVWYIGWVKLLGNRRHVGYLKVHHVPQTGQYVIELARLGKCPDQPIVIE